MFVLWRLLCNARKFSSSTAWKLFYVRYKKGFKHDRSDLSWLDCESFHGKHNPVWVSSICPRGRRFSLRLLGIDPSFNEYFGMYGARGCFRCEYSYTGCISCIAHDTLKPRHYMNMIITDVPNYVHEECGGKGCNTCLHKTRMRARSEYLEMFGG